MPPWPLSLAGSDEASGHVGVAHVAASKKRRPSGLHLSGAEFCQQVQDLEVGPSPAEPLGEIPALLTPSLQPEQGNCDPGNCEIANTCCLFFNVKRVLFAGEQDSNQTSQIPCHHLTPSSSRFCSLLHLGQKRQQELQTLGWQRRPQACQQDLWPACQYPG